MNPWSVFWKVLGALFVVFLLTPLFLVVIFAFTNRVATTFPIEHVSLTWWRQMIEHPQFWPSLRRSLIIGLTTAAVSATIGTMAAAGLTGVSRRASSVILALLGLPVMLPPLVVAVALVTFYVSVGIKLSLATVTLSHILITQPLVILIVYAQLREFDPRIIESARDLGASSFTAFRTITLPIVRPTVVGAALMAAAISFDDFVITFFTIGSGNTLPTFVWGMMRSSLTPVVNAIGTLLLCATILSTLIALWMTRYRG